MAFLVLAVAFGLVWTGFVLHTSGGTDLVFGKYSNTYAIFLLGLSTGGVALLYLGWRRRSTLARALQVVVAITMATFLLAALVLPPTYIYLQGKILRQDVFVPLPASAHSFYQIEEAQDPPPAADGEFRVLALGGSTTYGSRLERDESFPSVLERILQERFPERRIRVINAGVPWHTSMHSLLRYVGRYANWTPHVVIVMHAFNDIFQASEGRLTSGTFRPDYGHFFGALGMRVNPGDRLGAALEAAWSQNWLARTWYSDLRQVPPATPRRKVNLLRALPSFEHNLGHLLRRARDDGTTVIVLTQPYLYRDGMPSEEANALFYPYYYRDYAQVPTVNEQRASMDAFNDAARQAAQRYGAVLIDLEKAMPKSFALLYDDVHYTVRGAQQVALFIADGVDWSSLMEKVSTTRTDQSGRVDRPGRQ